MERFSPICGFDGRAFRRRGAWLHGRQGFGLVALGACGVIFLVAATAAIPPQAMAAPIPHKEHKREARREIEAVEEEWRTAQLAGDVATMSKLLADDYFGISIAGQLNNKTQQLERLQKHTLVLTKIDVSDVKIKLLGRVAIVTSLAEIEGMNDGESMHGTYRYTRVYKRYPDGSWKITNFEVTRVPGAA
jgi:ketosteroid isomerase-like protein